MDSTHDCLPEQRSCGGDHCHRNDYLSELDPWFLVSGDADDFIFYGEPDRAHSEK